MATDPSLLIASLLQGGANVGQSVQQGFSQGLQDQGQQQAIQIGQQQVQAGQLANAATVQQQALAAQKAQDYAVYLANPNPTTLGVYARKHPEDADSAVKGYNAMDDVQKTSQLTQFGQLFSSADNNRPDLVTHQLTQIKQAELKQNPLTDVSAVDDALTELASGDPDRVKAALNGVKGLAQIHIAASDPAKFAQTYSDFGGTDDTGDGSTKIAHPGDVLLDKNGKVLYSGGGAQAPGAGGPAGVAPTSLPDIADRIGAIEGTGQNPSSTAKYYGQFTNGTWLTTYKSQYPNSGLTDAQILAKKADPSVSKSMLGVLTGQNAQTLQAAGVQPNAGNVYLAHFLGAGGALSVLHADPNTPVSQILPLSVIKANSSVLGGQTAGQVQAWANQKMTQGAPNSGASADPGALNSDALALMVDQYRHGDKTVLQNLGRGKQGAQNVVAFRNLLASSAKADGVTGGDLAATMAQYQGDVAAERTAGSRMANAELASNEASRLIPIALRTSALLDRSGWLPLARVQLAIANGTNKPAYRAFNAANTALVNAYSRAISPSGAALDSDKRHAYDMLNTAFDQQSYAKTVGIMQQEIAAARQAPGDVRASLHSDISGRPAQPAVPVAQAPANAPSPSAPTRFARNPQTGQRLGLINGQWVAVQ